MSYFEKHKRNSSPILRTTSEDRIKQNSLKETNISYLEQQIQKVQLQLTKKYEERIKFVEETLSQHEDKFDNFIKLIKLLQHFATTQEQENQNIKNHINLSMEQLYHEELNYLKQQNLNIQLQLEDIQKIYEKEQPQIQELETIINKKIDIIMDEVRNSALKTDYEKIEQKLLKLEQNFKQEYHQKSNDSDKILNNSLMYQNQLNDLKIVLDSVIKDQEQTKNYIKYIELDLNQNKQKEKINQIRSSVRKESQPTESDIMFIRPIRDQKENIKNNENKRNKSKSSQSRSQSRNARLETIKKKKQESVKELIKKHKQQPIKLY
ncbi:unnamed protein product [Paramecium sonneborni]|uniref:Uncharacterized protein n=1 Tax=Paramecium sonneborni TaxID=65129 RepID=A0A8S1L744_9CILI|nr:unnamed protein product [Paramecium sonneborni]